MLKFSYFLHAIIVALLAGTLEAISYRWDMLVSWTAFASWACYFIFVTEFQVKETLKVMTCWAFGVFAAVAVVLVGQELFMSRLNVEPTRAFPFALMLVAFFVICFERIKIFDWIPVWFVGAACFFALHDPDAKEFSLLFHESAILIIGCIVGQFFGFLTVFLRGRYQHYVDSVF